MKNNIAPIIGGIAVVSALVLAPLAAANGDGSGGSGHSPTGGVYRQPVVPAMQIGTTASPSVPGSVEPTPFATPAIKAKP